VEDDTRDDEEKEDDTEEPEHALTPVEDDPADIQGRREHDEADSEDAEEDDGSAPAADHPLRIAVSRSEGRGPRAEVRGPSIGPLVTFRLQAEDMRDLQSECPVLDHA